MKHLLLFLVLTPILSFGQASFNMTLLGNVDLPLPVRSGATYNDCWGYRHANGTEVAIIGGTEHILFVNVTNPTSPIIIYQHLVTNIPSGINQSVWRDFQVYQNYVYACSDEGAAGLLIFDMSNVPSSITLVTQTNQFFEQAHTIFIDEENGRLYAGGTENNVLGVTVLNLNPNPTSPTLVQMIPLNSFGGGYTHEVYARDGIVYCSHIFDGKLIIYNFNNLPNISVVGVIEDYPGQGLNHSSWLSEDGNYLLMTDETHGSAVKLVDVTDPANISANDIYTFSNQLLPVGQSIAHNPFIHNGYAYLSYYHDGVQVFDISNPQNITLAAYYDTYWQNTNYNGYEGCWGIYPFFQSGIIIASDITNGLFILEMEADPLAIQFIQFEATRDDEEVELNWTVADVPPGNIFEIQRSDNGGLSFATIGTTEYKNSQFAYRFIDNQASTFRPYLYRIAFVQADGKFLYSPIRSVGSNENEMVIGIVNPMQQSLILDFSKTLTNVHMTIFDLEGRQLWEEKVEKGTGRLQYDLPWLIPGTYLLSMQWEGGSQHVMVQKVN